MIPWKGRKEIRGNWPVILFRCIVFVVLVRISWLSAVFEVMGWEPGQGFVALVTGGVFAVVKTLGA